MIFGAGRFDEVENPGPERNTEAKHAGVESAY